MLVKAISPELYHIKGTIEMYWVGNCYNFSMALAQWARKQSFMACLSQEEDQEDTDQGNNIAETIPNHKTTQKKGTIPVKRQ